jgi:hypothetical protein
MVLLAFLASLALVVAASAYAVVQGVSLWRHTKRTGGAFTGELALFEVRAARAEQLMSEAESANVAFQAAQARLGVSLARLRVLLNALERAQQRTRWLRTFLPSR